MPVTPGSRVLHMDWALAVGRSGAPQRGRIGPLALPFRASALTPLDNRKISSYCWLHAATQAWNPAAARDRDPRGGAVDAGASPLPRIRSCRNHARAERVTFADGTRNPVQGLEPAGAVRSAHLPVGGRSGG